MAGTISLYNYFSYANQGQTVTGQHGAITTVPTTPLSVTTTGPCKYLEGTLATATVVTAYTAANDFPATFIYGFYWSDQISYIQLIGSATNSIHKVAATQPFVIPGYGNALGAASTTIMAGGAEPSTTAMTKIVLGNYSGTTMNYVLFLVL